MSHFSITVTLLMLSLSSTVLHAQSEHTLEDAVREQYVEQVNENDLKEMAKKDSLSALDQYSHFLSVQELIDVSSQRSAESFVLPLNEQVWYMRIPLFHAKTSSQVHQAIVVARRQSNASNIIIDLRGNTGGLLNAAIEVADEFIANGVLATTVGRMDIANLVFVAEPNGLLEDKNIAILIDKNTASAAELLAGILKLDAGACIVGQNSFGKSAVQTQIHLISGGALSLTTASYKYSNGKTVDQQGMRPDILISSWHLVRNPVYLIDQRLTENSIRNPLIKKSLHCMGAQ